MLSNDARELVSPGNLRENSDSDPLDCGAVQLLPDKQINADGRVIAGNISTFNLMLATPYMPSLAEAVLFLEYDREEGFALPSIERFLWQLRLAGVFNQIKGLVFGVLQPSVQDRGGPKWAAPIPEKPPRS